MAHCLVCWLYLSYTLPFLIIQKRKQENKFSDGTRWPMKTLITEHFIGCGRLTHRKNTHDSMKMFFKISMCAFRFDDCCWRRKGVYATGTLTGRIKMLRSDGSDWKSKYWTRHVVFLFTYSLEHTWLVHKSGHPSSSRDHQTRAWNGSKTVGGRRRAFGKTVFRLKRISD